MEHRANLSRFGAYRWGITISLMVSGIAYLCLPKGTNSHRAALTSPQAGLVRQQRPLIPILLAVLITGVITGSCTDEQTVPPTPVKPANPNVSQTPTRIHPSSPTDTPLPTATNVLPTPSITAPTVPLPSPTPSRPPTVFERPCGRFCEPDFWATASVSDIQDELDAGARLDARSREHHSATPLHLAVTNDARPDVVSLLLNLGANVSAIYNQGQTPLHAAILGGADPEVVELLLDGGANVVYRNEGKTPLSRALGNDADAEIIRLLLDRGGFVASRPWGFDDPWSIALQGHSDPEVLDLLLPKYEEADFHGDDFSTFLSISLTLSVVNSELGIIEWLLAHGANFGDFADPTYGSLLVKAILYNHNPDVVDLLLDRGDDVNASWSLFDLGITPLHVAVMTLRTEVVATLLNRGADVNAVDNEGHTPLFLLFPHSRDRLGSIAHELEHFYDEDADERRRSIAMLLLRNGADLNATDSRGYTPLHMATAWINQDPQFVLVVQEMLDRGANVNATDRRGNTPLHWATAGINRDPQFVVVVEEMLDRGANVEARNDAGRTVCETTFVPLPEALHIRRRLCPLENFASPFSRWHWFEESDALTAVCAYRWEGFIPTQQIGPARREGGDEFVARARWGNVPETIGNHELTGFKIIWSLPESDGSVRDSYFSISDQHGMTGYIWLGRLPEGTDLSDGSVRDSRSSVGDEHGKTGYVWLGRLPEGTDLSDDSVRDSHFNIGDEHRRASYVWFGRLPEGTDLSFSLRPIYGENGEQAGDGITVACELEPLP